MQFKHPEILYALFLLLIPIIVHLFQLRKFQKVDFTNVAFLKEVVQQTRQSSQIKKWLILCTRLLLLATLVIAFAQPFTSKTNAFTTKTETVIYVDNSFSMQAKGEKGELLKRAVNDIIDMVPENENLSLITNDNIYKNTSIKAIKNDLLQLQYSASKLSIEEALLKSKTVLSNKKNVLKNLILISDFQENDASFKPIADTLTNINFVKLQPVNTNNAAIDSVYISETTASSIELKVLLKNTGTAIDNLTISLFNDEKLIAKTSVTIENKAETTFSLPADQIINGKITIDDGNLEFDNSLYFNINKASKINILVINATNDDFLKRIFLNTEFNYTSTTENQLNYSIIDNQNLIVLHELNTIPVALNTALNQFVRNGGSLLIIPSNKINTNSYNQLLVNYQASFTELNSSEKQITTINYAHPLYKGVFEKQVSNFQYPKVNSFYGLSSNTYASVLQFEDKKVFLGQSQSLYIFTAALNDENSSFKNSPLIVPTLYNIAKQSFKIPELYYIIGEKNTFDVETQLQQDAVLSLVNNDVVLIPKQQYFNNKVVITTIESPNIAATYTINNKTQNIKNLSYNYNRNESDLVYTTLSSSKNITLSNSITSVFDSIKSDSKINALWKWFAIFALALLIIEMLILKFFK